MNRWASDWTSGSLRWRTSGDVDSAENADTVGDGVLGKMDNGVGELKGAAREWLGRR